VFALFFKTRRIYTVIALFFKTRRIYTVIALFFKSRGIYTVFAMIFQNTGNLHGVRTLGEHKVRPYGTVPDLAGYIVQAFKSITGHECTIGDGHRKSRTTKRYGTTRGKQ